MNQNEDNVNAIINRDDVQFYTIADLVSMLGWSTATVQKLFNDPDFPAVNYGKNKVVEKHALIDYFSRRRDKSRNRYWRS